MIDDETFLSNRVAELEEQIARLLAAARAAKDVYSTGFVQMLHQVDGRHFYLVPVDDMEEFRDKLDAVEDLL